MGDGYTKLDISSVLDSMGPDYPLDFKTGQPRQPPMPEYGHRAETIPHLATWGKPSSFSTCTALIPVGYRPIFDVNRYYRSLGFIWPYRPVTRAMLRQHYLRLNGQDDPWLSYCLHRLLDPTVRDRYDRAELGHPLSDDLWIQDWIERKLSAEISRKRRQRGPEYDEDDLAREWHLPRPESASAADLGPSGATPGPLPRVLDWPYSYYLLNSRRFDPQFLSEWQSMLIAACREEGLSIELALGYLGGTEDPWCIASTYKDPHIALINETHTETHPHIAQQIATALATELNRGDR